MKVIILMYLRMMNCLALNVYDAFAQGILDQVYAVMDIELSHEPCFVSFNSFWRDYQHIGDLPGSIPLGHQFEYLSLPVGELRIRVVTNLPASMMVELNQEFGYRWGKIGISMENRTDTRG